MEDAEKRQWLDSIWRNALVAAEVAAGEEEIDTVQDIAESLILFLNRRALWSEAVPLIQQTLRLQEKTLGLEHPYTATSLNNLAYLYQSQGRLSEADLLYKRALTIQQKMLGVEHPNTIIVTRNYATLLKTMGKMEEAKMYFARADQAEEARKHG